MSNPAHDEPVTPADDDEAGSHIPTGLARGIDPLDLLRVPFAPSQIGVLPKPYKKDSPKGDCRECGGRHGLPAVHLDYVGHAAVTARLLDVDPHWTWEPVAWTDAGTPLITQRGPDAVMWIRLTVAGHTRLGVGTCSANTFEVEKQLISDAIRNAAMRFGVALDLWSKEDLHDTTNTVDDDPPPAPQPGPPIPDGEKARLIINQAKQELFDLTGDVASAASLWESVIADYPGADHDDPATAEALLASARTLTAGFEPVADDE